VFKRSLVLCRGERRGQPLVSLDKFSLGLLQKPGGLEGLKA
jgi:hypothetical protein